MPAARSRPRPRQDQAVGPSKTDARDPADALARALVEAAERIGNKRVVEWVKALVAGDRAERQAVGKATH